MDINDSQYTIVSRGIIQEIFTPGKWIQLHPQLLLIMDSDCAIMLSTLINQCVFLKALEKKDGWFFCTMERIEAKCYFSYRKQSRVLKKLIDMEFIKTKKKGVPAKRYIWINYSLFYNSIQKQLKKRNEGKGILTNPRQSSEDTCVSTGEDTCVSTINTENIKKKTIPTHHPSPTAFGANAPLPLGVKEIDIKWSKELIKGLHDKNKLKRVLSNKKASPSRLNSWAKEFKSLRKELNNDKERITRVINWYIPKIGNKYIPMAFSAKSFKDKFIQIETSMENNKDNITQVEEIPIAINSKKNINRKTIVD